jgi:hypothetical protein
MELELDGKIIQIDEKLIKVLIEKNPSLVKRCYLEAHGYSADDTSNPQFLQGLWEGLKSKNSHEDAIAEAKAKRVRRIENNSRVA